MGGRGWEADIDGMWRMDEGKKQGEGGKCEVEEEGECGWEMEGGCLWTMDMGEM